MVPAEGGVLLQLGHLGFRTLGRGNSSDKHHKYLGRLKPVLALVDGDVGGARGNLGAFAQEEAAVCWPFSIP